MIQFRLLAAFLLLCIATTAFAWRKEDYEIFDLLSALEATEGKGTTFYSLLDVPFTATSADISKSYRKKSITMHPDKNPGIKGIEERYARLGVVAKILRDPEGRERYDFFYKNGTPKWRGTGYYYSRFRPGLGTVLTFLTIITSLMQHIVQRLNRTRDIARIERIVQQARRAAWGPKMVPLSGPRKVKISLGATPMMASDNDESDYDERPTSGGKTIPVLVDGDQVYLLEDGYQTPLNESMAPRASILDTWFITILRTLVSRVTGVGSKHNADATDSSDAGDTTEVDDTTDGLSSDANAKANGGRQAAVKAGGRRRKFVKKN